MKNNLRLFYLSFIFSYINVQKSTDFKPQEMKERKKERILIERMKERKREKEKERKKESKKRERKKERKIPANCRVDQLLVSYKKLKEPNSMNHWVQIGLKSLI